MDNSLADNRDLESQPDDDARPSIVRQDCDTMLPAAARRALAEAQARRVEIDRAIAARPKELAGRKGPDPVRYGDWEVKGIASDF